MGINTTTRAVTLKCEKSPFREKDLIFTKRTLSIINIGNVDIFFK